MKKQPAYITKEIKAFTIYLKGYKEKTQLNYINHLKQFLLWYGKRPAKKDSMLNILKTYRTYLINLSYKSTTINLNLTTVKNYFNKVLHKYDEIKRLKKPKRKKKTEYYTQDEITKLLNSTHNIKHNAFFRLAYGNGCRITEILNMKKRDININNHEIYFEKRKIIADTETMKLLMVLTQYKKQDDYVFTNSNNQQLTERSMQHAFYKKINKIGLKNKGGFSVLKKSHIVSQLQNGKDLNYIKNSLGYSNIKTVQTMYKHLAPDNNLTSTSILNDNVGIIKQYIVSVYGNGKLTIQELKE